MSSSRTAIYPASFDPVTNGHLDLIERSLSLFDHLIVAVATNRSKSGLFSVEERLDMVSSVLGDHPRITIDTIDGLLVDYAKVKNAPIVIRGLRAISDFEYEFEMAQMNKHMYPDIEMVFLMTGERWFYVSSSRLREIVSFGGDVSDFVPALVHERLKNKLKSKS